MNPADEVRTLFADYRFGPPCTDSNIQSAEAALGEPLPPVLRDLYLAFDGFRGPTNERFLWPLFGPEGLVAMNHFFRGDETFPQEVVSQCLFFGDYGLGPLWAIKRDLPGKVIKWDGEWDDFEVAGDSPLDVWRRQKEWFESLEGAR
jgi:SMI1 / KNR4 family (SUKH-1)